ncbi:MAG: class II aldolase/adducin family protein [Phyllobacteriaceae bacterium]|jgi:ribulose-5-phosphate 4-epimerase/fuculose-1-phosphate aldolase|nr:class II aldolase/adducin family protein [Phyllobacteriaceae bacterium]
MNEANARLDLAAAHRISVLEGLNEGTWTHFSCKIGDGEQYLVTPGSTHFSMVSASSLLLHGRDGELLSGDGQANHDALPIHLPIYEARPDVRCVLHFHSPHATALTVFKDMRLDTRLSQTAAYFHGKVGYLSTYAVPRTNTAEGEKMAEALGTKKVLFMKNHGVLIAASSLADASVSACQLERACQIQLLAAATRAETERMSEKFAEMLASEECNGEPGYLDGMKRLLERVQPDFQE